MRVPSRGQNQGLSNNMTPMIDVVFLLIIFFLVSSHLARQESHVPLLLPTADSHLPPNLEASALTLNILADGTWKLGGTQVDTATLSGALQEYRKRNGANALVRIRTDRAVPYERLEPLLREAAKAGLPNISIAVYQPNSGKGGG